MSYRRPRKVNTSQMPDIPDAAVLDNFYPCLCNGKTDVIDRAWNKRGLYAEFHIPDGDYKGKEATELQKEMADDMVAFMYLVYENDSVIAKGNVIYNLHTGGIKRFTCDADEKAEMETFIKNLIQYFAEINYVAKMNAMNRQKNKHTTKKNSNPNTKSNADVKYDFKVASEQPAYVPRRKAAKPRNRTNTVRARKNSTPKTRNVTRTHIVYNLEFWERAGYYRKDGIYVKPCSCRRHTQ